MKTMQNTRLAAGRATLNRPVTVPSFSGFSRMPSASSFLGGEIDVPAVLKVRYEALRSSGQRDREPAILLKERSSISSFVPLSHPSSPPLPLSSLTHTQAQSARRPSARAAASPVVAMASGVSPKKILIMGGTRFIGVYLARELVAAGHEVYLLTRGKKPVTFKLATESDAAYKAFSTRVKHIKADRKDYAGLRNTLSNYR
jgi:hypothetical protein